MGAHTAGRGKGRRNKSGGTGRRGCGRAGGSRAAPVSRRPDAGAPCLSLSLDTLRASATRRRGPARGSAPWAAFWRARSWPASLVAEAEARGNDKREGGERGRPDEHTQPETAVRALSRKGGSATGQRETRGRQPPAREQRPRGRPCRGPTAGENSSLIPKSPGKPTLKGWRPSPPPPSSLRTPPLEGRWREDLRPVSSTRQTPGGGKQAPGRPGCQAQQMEAAL